jgi:hypothetical protein
MFGRCPQNKMSYNGVESIKEKMDNKYHILERPLLLQSHNVVAVGFSDPNLLLLNEQQLPAQKHKKISFVFFRLMMLLAVRLILQDF